jgi:predicted dienelactone hydrolase
MRRKRMRKTLLTAIALALLISGAWAQEKVSAQQQFPVGVTNRAFLSGDPSYDWRAAKTHALPATIWYPAATGSVETAQWVGDPPDAFASAGRAARDTGLAAAPAGFPLILLSHGTGGSALMMAWLGTALAAHGYIAAAVNHPGNNALEPYTLQGFSLGWERAMDIGRGLD